ncbi:hypothetical protein SAMN05192533_108212 [Mesobacillus persicus]|uniref:Uncharacterized protein n=1 Tax=Mesobacillus persicus TaxID=930146 RepID=A0A1H8DGW5_9BACI|nr:hypothetical protein [Mesobacillus persicus]SEN06529.1 hypothetical protein SAMN05192533_108212 [Mesobacillus persicus]
MNISIVSNIIDEVTEGIYNDFPELLTKYGEAGKNKCREDNQHHFKQLKIALEMNNVELFIDYALWLNQILTSRGMQTAHLIDNFRRIESALANVTDPDQTGYISFLKAAIHALENK